MDLMLKDKTCIITGAGRGIGRAAALLFAREGGRVVISDLDEAPAMEVVEEIKAGGGKAVACVGDVTADDFAEKLINTAVKSFGPGIDVIVNNAGYTWDGVIHKMTDQQWEAMLKVHITAPFRIIRAAAPYIRDAAKKEKEAGIRVTRKIINISSVAGLDGNAGQANYSSAKAAVVGLTKTLAKEWGPFNVCVNTVAFGFIETRLTQAKEKGEAIKLDNQEVAIGIPDSMRKMFTALIPLRRPGTPEEAANAILLMASPLADYISGEVLRVTGGM
ncbi:SDR family NAD(P)-dependent oxidoreductase [Desulfoscipio geothermicus]|uniref:3-oxoacyl-[acyl-carrier protein] reductase n=1 Tax=Desulfoscipio geothermicus DSM 3669 TaxID=1121426 RepID=A0A1I6DYG9_9FIRM|nr:SDR family oxidoreductase [Desulfoscipio geothermicus]SFR10427.1 3-oxoacyl-[acyl-carrier protein] reductase [Desulfoscipio geothermicus DSM 3669]